MRYVVERTSVTTFVVEADGEEQAVDKVLEAVIANRGEQYLRGEDVLDVRAVAEVGPDGTRHLRRER